MIWHHEPVIFYFFSKWMRQKSYHHFVIKLMMQHISPVCNDTDMQSCYEHHHWVTPVQNTDTQSSLCHVLIPDLSICIFALLTWVFKMNVIKLQSESPGKRRRKGWNNQLFFREFNLQVALTPEMILEWVDSDKKLWLNSTLIKTKKTRSQIFKRKGRALMCELFLKLKYCCIISMRRQNISRMYLKERGCDLLKLNIHF